VCARAITVHDLRGLARGGLEARVTHDVMRVPVRQVHARRIAVTHRQHRARGSCQEKVKGSGHCGPLYTDSRCKKSLSTKVSNTSSLRSAHLRVHEGVRESFQAPPGRQSSAEGPLRSWPHAQLTATSVPMDTSLLDSTMAALTLRAGHSAANTGRQR
jgi:hypothetical protein